MLTSSNYFDCILGEGFGAWKGTRNGEIQTWSSEEEALPAGWGERRMGGKDVIALIFDKIEECYKRRYVYM